MSDDAADPSFPELVIEAKRITGLTHGNSQLVRAAVVVMAAVIVGPDVPAIVAFTGYARAWVEEVGERLRRGGVWVGDKVVAEWLAAETAEPLGVVLDAMVAVGELERHPDPGAPIEGARSRFGDVDPMPVNPALIGGGEA